MVDLIENRVYVQMDKFTLTAFDRKYAFVCELSTNFSIKTTTNPPILISSTLSADEREIRRRPISPTNNLWENNILRSTSLIPIIPQNMPTKSLLKIFNKKFYFILFSYKNSNASVTILW